MALRMMTDATEAHLPNVETVNDYSGHETGLVRHDAKTCPKHNTYDRSGALSAECVAEHALHP